jgi:lysophospholipase L1-like esterase
MGNTFQRLMRIGALGGGVPFSYSQRLINIIGAPYLLRYYPLQDLSGTAIVDKSPNAVNGTYAGSPTLGEPGVVTGRKSVKFVTDSYGNIYSASLNSGYSPDELTVGHFFLVPNAGWWTDGAQHNTFQLRSDVSNLRYIYKNISNILAFANISGGTSKAIQASATYVPLYWIHILASVSKSNDRVRLFINGSLVNSANGLGSYVGALASTQCVIGNLSTTHAYASLGWQSDFFIATRELSLSEISIVSNPFSGNVTNYLAIGDSKTANEPNWATYLNDAMATVNKRWVKLPIPDALGGWTTAIVQAGIDAYLASVSEVPNYVIVNLGANDVSGGDPGATWETNTKYICSAVHTKYPGAIIYLTKIFRHNTGQQAAGIAAMNGYIDDIVATAPYSGYVRVGVNEANLFNEGNYTTYSADGIHWNVAGCVLWASAFQSMMGF